MDEGVVAWVLDEGALTGLASTCARDARPGDSIDPRRQLALANRQSGVPVDAGRPVATRRLQG